MRHPLAACTLAAALFALPPMAGAQDLTAETVVARVGEVEITLGHVVLLRQQLPQQYANLPDDVLMQGIIEQLVDQQLLSEQAADTPRRVEMKLENERRALLASEEIAKIVEGTIPEAELTAAYEEAFVNVEPEMEFNASHILVETEEEAAALVTELEGGADFAELAKEKSTGPSGPNGGELGWFGKGRMVPEFETAVLEMEAESISAPVQTQFGWHVIRLNEVREVPAPTLEEARGQLEAEIRQGRLDDHIASLREAASVEILTEELPAEAIRNDDILMEK